jgi:DNA replication protein DnaC
MLDTTFKKLCLKSKANTKLQELAISAYQQREYIWQKIKELNQSSMLSSENSVLPPNSVLQLSKPTFHTELLSPFIGGVVPERFKAEHRDDQRNWFYMGREKFTELLDKYKAIHKDISHSEVIIYGTRGYGKSHLLAALVCYLAAEEQKVVYIPDCWNLIHDLV